MTVKRTILLATAGLALATLPAEAGSCVRKGAIGSAWDKPGAMLQVDEALLQAVDWGLWGAWMSSGNKVGAAARVGGYTFGARSYNCKGSGGNWTCRGSATICKN